MQTSAFRTWDPLVRLTHWAVAAGVLINAVLSEEGSLAHQWVGYGVGALLLLRWIWGLIGSPEARFSAFPPSPARAMAHVREIARGEKTRYRSHNPLGALMVYALWATMAVVIGTGVAMSGLPHRSTSGDERVSMAALSSGIAVSRDDDDAPGEAGRGGGGENAMEEIHEVAANLLLVLAGVHLLGVAFETQRSGRGVVLRMLPGLSGRRPEA